MDSKLRCVFAMPAGKEENNIESKYEPGQMAQPAPSQPAASVKVNYKLTLKITSNTIYDYNYLVSLTRSRPSVRRLELVLEITSCNIS